MTNLDAMGARDAWVWLQENQGFGLKSSGLEFYALPDGRVEAGHIGCADAIAIGQPEFLNDFSGRTFVPLDTADYGGG